MEQFIAVAVVIAFGISILNIIKMAAAGETNKVATAVAGYAVFIALAFVLRDSDFAGSVAVGDFSLSSLNAWSTVLFGASLAGTAGTAYDALPINTPSFGANTPDA